MMDNAYKSFWADIDLPMCASQVEVICTDMLPGKRMTILTEEYPVYITKQQAMEFFNLRSNE